MALATVGVRYLVKDLSTFVSAMSITRRQLSQTSASVKQTSTATRGLVAGLSVLNFPSKALQGFGSLISKTGAEIGKLGRSLTNFGLSASIFLTLPVLAAGRAVVSSAVTFEQSMTKIITLVGLAGDQVEQLGQQVVRLGPELGKSPNELAEALFFAASGLREDLRTNANIMSVLEASAKASALGLGETKDVVLATNSVINAYGTEAYTAAQVTDILTAAVNRGQFEADQLAGSLNKVLGQSASLGIQFEEIAGFVATYSLVATTASQATTGLSSVISAFQKPTNRTIDALGKLGLTVDDVLQSFAEFGVSRTLVDLRSRIDDVGVSMAEVFGRKEAIRAFSILTGELADTYLNNMAAIQNANGITEQGFEVLQQTAGFQIERMKASLESLGLTIGGAILPAINQLIQRMLPLILAMTEWLANNPRIVQLVAIFAGLAAVIGPLVAVFGLLVSGIGAFLGLIGSAVAAVGALISPFGILIAVVGGAAAVIAGLFVNSIRVLIKDSNMTFGDFAKRAFAWGKNIIIQLAKGIAAATFAVVNALITVGKVIADWLRPGSPPKLLPDLTDWGTGAAQAWLDGWTKADFGTFDELASTVEGFLRSFTEEMGEDKVLKSILNMRSGLVAAINEFREFGDISIQTLDEISFGFGQSSQTIREYVVIMARLQAAQEAVAAAQAEINRINQEFEANTGPINDELESIERRRQEVKDQMRLETLQAIIDDENAPALAKELALMEMREIRLRNQLQAQEDVRDEALEAANAELAAAQAEEARLQANADAHRALIDLQIEQRGLLQEQKDLLEEVSQSLSSVSESLAGVGESLGSISEGLGDIAGGFGDLGQAGMTSLGDVFGEGFTQSFEDLKGEIASIFEEISGEFSGLGTKLDELGVVWGEVFGLIGERILSFSTYLGERIGPEGTWTVWFNELKGTIQQWFRDIGEYLLGGETDWEGFNEFLLRFNEDTTEWMDGLREFMGEWFGWLADELFGSEEDWTKFFQSTKDQWRDVKEDFLNKWEEIKQGFNDMGEALFGGEENWNAFKDTVGRALDILKDVGNYISGTLQGLLSGLHFPDFNLPFGGGVDDNIPGGSTGGRVMGGTPGKDSVLMRLMPGEHILNVSQTKALDSFLQSVNAPPAFSPAMATVNSGGNTENNINFDTTISNGMDEATFKAMVLRVLQQVL